MQMKIKWTTVYVNDQEKALKFYTDVLGFRKKSDFSQGPYRWLTVAGPDEPDGVELILEANTNPAAKAFQEAMYGKQTRAAQFLVSDVQAEHDRLAAKGVKFTMPVTKVTGSVIAVLDDTCGNLIQLIQLAW
jgi:predicted enzyme related to lactoylglutathione lyase